MKRTLMNRLVAVAVMAVMTLTAAYGADPVAMADSAYAKGDYAQAVELYKEIASKEGVSSALWYDMGNAYSKGGYYGRALVCFVRALRMDPSNSQAKSNIRYIESKVAENNRAEIKGKKMSIEQESPSFFRNVRLYISRDHLSDTWAIWAVVFFLILVGCAAVYIFSSNVMARKFGFFGGFVSLGLTAIFLVFAFMAASYVTDEGVITEGKVKLMSEASAASKESAVALTRGTRMAILDSIPVGEGRAEWYKVRLNSDFVGWITADNFEPIDY